MMTVNKRYLIAQNGKSIREWECLEVADSAFKVQDKIQGDSYSIFSTIKVDTPFWILKSDIDKIGNTIYRILEELS